MRRLRTEREATVALHCHALAHASRHAEGEATHKQDTSGSGRAHETTHACAGRSVSSGQVTGHLNLHTVIHTYREDRRTVDDARSPAKSLPHPTDGDSRLAMYVCTRELPKEGAHARECTKQANHTCEGQTALVAGLWAQPLLTAQLRVRDGLLPLQNRAGRGRLP